MDVNYNDYERFVEAVQEDALKYKNARDELRSQLAAAGGNPNPTVNTEQKFNYASDKANDYSTWLCDIMNDSERELHALREELKHRSSVVTRENLTV